MLFYFTDCARLITFYLFKFIFRNELQQGAKCFSLVLSLSEKTQATTLLNWDWLYDILDLDLKDTQTALRDSAWFFDILDLKSVQTTFTGVRLILWHSGRGLKNAWAAWLDSVCFYTLDLDCGLIKWSNQAEMSLEKYEDVFELSVKQFVIHWSPTSLGQVMRGLWKTKC